MRVNTFYFIVNGNNKSIVGNEFAIKEDAIEEMNKVARANPGTKYHLMKRLVSVYMPTADLVWEDSY